MHSIWQEQMEFPVYPILKRDKKTDILYVGATLKHAIEANFQKEMGRSVMIIEEKSIGDMPELGGMGIFCIIQHYFTISSSSFIPPSTNSARKTVPYSSLQARGISSYSISRRASPI